jgi:crotonobetainyl-CoA:carnitine CoA-transferase CaiB-like acyl-CoA transferase
VDAVERALATWVATQDRDELVAELLARGIAAAPVASYQDLIGSDWKSDRALTVPVAHPYLGETEVFLVPWRFGGERPTVAAPAPLLGSSTEQVLGELLGMPADEVQRLQRDLVLH